MKKFLSTILAVVMVLSSMAMVVSAEVEGFDYVDGKYYVGTQDYDSLSAAVSAAGAGGTVTIAGTVEFGSRQGISTNITLEGVNNATIIPSETYGAVENTTNWKGLLNLAGNITVKNITFDGSRYGLQENRLEDDFVPVRCTSGNITLENVTILGSDRTLMNVGSSTTSATVTANGLYCTAPVKTIKDATTYADVNVVNGTFNLNSGAVDGLICTDSGSGYAGALGTVSNNHFTLNCHYTILGFIKRTADVTSTLKHYVDTYEYSKTLASQYKNDFLATVTDADNSTAMSNMVGWAETNADSELKASFGNLLLDGAGYAEDGSATEQLLIGYAARLGVTEE